jgi:hypothetical protein
VLISIGVSALYDLLGEARQRQVDADQRACQLPLTEKAVGIEVGSA